MTAGVEIITCNFIGDFKVGDNIVANANTLCRLSVLNQKGDFNKLMVVQAGSIVEAALDQVIYRAQNYTKEGVPNIPADEIKKIQSTTIERLNNIIQTMKARKLLDGLGAGVYDDLNRLRELRNGIHIDANEHKTFADKEVVWALSFCIKILKHLSDKYPRPKDLEQFAHKVSIPKA